MHPMVLAVWPAVPTARPPTGVRVAELLAAGCRRLRPGPMLRPTPVRVPEDRRSDETGAAAVTVLWRRLRDPGRAAALAELLFRAAVTGPDSEDGCEG